MAINILSSVQVELWLYLCVYLSEVSEIGIIYNNNTCFNDVRG